MCLYLIFNTAHAHYIENTFARGIFVEMSAGRGGFYGSYHPAYQPFGEHPTGSGSGHNSSQGHPLPQRRTATLSEPSGPSPGSSSKLDEIIMLLQYGVRSVSKLPRQLAL